MSEHNANLGSLSMTEAPVLAGAGPHVIRTELLKAGQDELAAGLVVSLDADEMVVPFDAAQSKQIGAGDGEAAGFSATLGPLVPGSVSLADGVETFSDDGFGTLTGDAEGTGKVNYDTGAITVTFNTAPLAEAAVTAAYKPVARGVLARKAATGQADCDLVVHGKVNRGQLAIGGAAPTAAQILMLDRLGIWAIG